MECIIDKTDVETQLETLLREIFMSDRNKTVYEEFHKVSKDLKPKSCVVKTGWISDKFIAFNCKCEKNGEGEIIKEIVKGMQHKTEDLEFIYEFKPDVLQFESEFIVDEPDYFYFRFKLNSE